MDSRTSCLYCNVKRTTKMTTLRKRNTVQIKARTFRTEKFINTYYNRTFQHVNPQALVSEFVFLYTLI